MSYALTVHFLGNYNSMYLNATCIKFVNISDSLKRVVAQLFIYLLAWNKKTSFIYDLDQRPDWSRFIESILVAGETSLQI